MSTSDRLTGICRHSPGRSWPTGAGTDVRVVGDETLIAVPASFVHKSAERVGTAIGGHRPLDSMPAMTPTGAARPVRPQGSLDGLDCMPHPIAVSGHKGMPNTTLN